MNDKKKEIIKLKKKKRIYIFMIMIGLFIVVGVGIYLLNPSPLGLDSQAIVGTSSGMSEEEIKEARKQKLDKNLFAVSMNTTNVFKDGGSKGVMNIEVAPNNYYSMRIEIALADNDKTLIYKSDRIDPGYIIREDQLDKKLDKGEYQCVATFIAIDQENEYKEVKRVSANIEVQVKE